MALSSTDTIEQNARRIVETLAGEFPSRHGTNPTALHGAASFIEKEFSSLGYAVQSRPYSADGVQVRNLIVERKGIHPGEPCIIIGAHYDTVRGTPGADDNASGIAGLIELSRLLREYPSQRTIKFSAFPHEEPPYSFTHQMGSRKYAQQLKEGKEPVVAMLALEMLGYAGKGFRQSYPVPMMRLLGRYPREGNYIALVSNLRSGRILSIVRKAMRHRGLVGVESLRAPGYIPPLFLSDHSSFWKYGYPALMITDTAFLRNPHYHASTDKADTLNYRFMAAVIEAIYDSVLALDGVN